jgi:KaiC/GvpD/RAD55 family RecA-like ATPase
MTTKSSLLKILEKSSRKGLGRGNLGVLVARAGVGKTACLVHIAMDKLLRNEKLVHASLQDSPEKVTYYYNVIFSELANALNLADPSELKAQIEKNRMILAYLNQSFDLHRLRENLKNLSERVGFVPDTLIVDGLDFSRVEAEMFEGFK